MRNANYVDMNFIMEKFKEEELPNVNTKEMRAREWVYEALRKIGSSVLYEAAELILIPDSDNRIKIPDYINYIRTVKNSRDESLVELKDSLTNKLSTMQSYFVRGRHIILNETHNEIKVEVMRIPQDDEGRPLVIDNEYVIAAVLAYLLHKISKKLWLTNRISYQKYQALEQEWLFYVNAAGTELDTPSYDELQDWDALNIGFPFSQLTRGGGTVDDYPRYVSPTTSEE
jgi:hypothetical protein